MYNEAQLKSCWDADIATETKSASANKSIVKSLQRLIAISEILDKGASGKIVREIKTIEVIFGDMQ
jgi:hypothetical protein